MAPATQTPQPAPQPQAEPAPKPTSLDQVSDAERRAYEASQKK